MKAFIKWRANLYRIIFDADTRAGKVFDILLIVSIILSVTVLMLDSIRAIRDDFGDFLYSIEWFFTVLFTVEYVLRLLCIGRPFRYATSFFGIVDLLAIVPTYLSLFVPTSHFLLVIRSLRVLRVFRVLKLIYYIGEANLIIQALQASRRKISVFLYTILTLVIILGALMYVIEDEENGFTSIPRSIYWAICSCPQTKNHFTHKHRNFLPTLNKNKTPLIPTLFNNNPDYFQITHKHKLLPTLTPNKISPATSKKCLSFSCFIVHRKRVGVYFMNGFQNAFGSR